MAAIGAKDTKPEMLVRRSLHSLGYRYRLHRRDLPGRPDLVFSSRRKIVEVRGCFWHHHPDPKCVNAVLPKTRADWWKAKLETNARRDEKNLASLSQLGWSTFIVWECELRYSDQVIARLRRFLDAPAGDTSAAKTIYASDVH